MGSMAMDGNGNIALGYSKSSATAYPSIAVTGRLAGDPLGTMGAEDVFVAGGGSQVNSSSRWGDYSTMSIDPVDDCTFWYTQQYYAETASFDFKTRIGAFRFASCTNTAALEGTVTDGSSPIAGATVTATPAGDQPTVPASTATTDASGRYQFLALDPGTYDVAVSRYGYRAVDGERSRRVRRRDDGPGFHPASATADPRRRHGHETAPARAGRSTPGSSFPARLDFRRRLSTAIR